jgi:uncharacterized membrane protein SpoIIM required for sporulation
MFFRLKSLLLFLLWGLNSNFSSFSPGNLISLIRNIYSYIELDISSQNQLFSLTLPWLQNRAGEADSSKM